jgi:hypothetical protein
MPFMPLENDLVLENEVQQFQIIFSKTSAIEDLNMQSTPCIVYL